jgi:hypothetical protein
VISSERRANARALPAVCDKLLRHYLLISAGCANAPWLELLLNVIALAGGVVVATYYRPSKKHDGQLH